MQSLVEMIRSGGFVMIPLIAASLLIWAIIFERSIRYWKLDEKLSQFQREVIDALTQKDFKQAKWLCDRQAELPVARLLSVALQSDTLNLQQIERNRQKINQELRKGLWILGTLGSASPFIGLFGTVVGILKSFQMIAETGKGGFAVVAAGISEALIATAAGILVAVVSVIAFNTFQVKWGKLVFTIRTNTEELLEKLK